MSDDTKQPNESTVQSEPHWEPFRLEFGEGVAHAPELMRFERVEKKTIWGYINGVKSETLDITLPEDFELPDPELPDREFLRAHIVATVRQFNGFGVGDFEIKKTDPALVNTNDPPDNGKRGKAYADLCWTFQGDDTNKNNINYSKTRDANYSSCAVVIRNLWKLLGARHTEYLNPPYDHSSSMVMEYLRYYAIYCHAFYGATQKKEKIIRNGAECLVPPIDPKEFDPKPGDALFVQDEKGSGHVFTITKVDENTIISCDGGQHGIGMPIPKEKYKKKNISATDGSCNGIRLRRHNRKKTLTIETYDMIEGYVERTITGWVKITDLLFTGELILLHRNEGAYYLPEPSPN
ncbi:MAG: hypothetical protein D3904_00325 [Candidatus Electrothrix sp. EH2]|nr:hypothetical protein [Candidatus Electrothrix sp. EH2]